MGVQMKRLIVIVSTFIFSINAFSSTFEKFQNVIQLKWNEAHNEIQIGAVRGNQKPHEYIVQVVKESDNDRGSDYRLVIKEDYTGLYPLEQSTSLVCLKIKISNLDKYDTLTLPPVQKDSWYYGALKCDNYQEIEITK